MHLKGRSLDRLLMLRPFTSLPLCPRENFNPPQMQTASPWKLLWKLPQQQNARRPQTFPFFWTFFFVLIFVVFEERRHCQFSSGSAGKVFIFGSVDRNGDVEGK